MPPVYKQCPHCNSIKLIRASSRILMCLTCNFSFEGKLAPTEYWCVEEIYTGGHGFAWNIYHDDNGLDVATIKIQYVHARTEAEIVAKEYAKSVCSLLNQWENYGLTIKEVIEYLKLLTIGKDVKELEDLRNLPFIIFAWDFEKLEKAWNNSKRA